MSEEIVQQETQPVARPGTAMPAASGQVTPDQMLQLAIEKGADLDKLEKLMDLRDRWEQNEARKAFEVAVSSAKAEIKPIIKTATVDFTSQKGRTHYQHETLDGIETQIGEILSAHGLSYRYRSRQESGQLFVTCVLAHRCGHSEETTLSGPPDQSGNKNAYQSVGSAATYLQRYTLKLALGLSAAKDTDGIPPQNAADYISQAQAKRLSQAIDMAGMDESGFCRQAGIESVENLEAHRFERAMAHLKQKAQGTQQ